MKHVTVLLIEDNPGDIELIKAGFEDAKMFVDLEVIEDGQEALDYFTREEKVPDLVLLDINLPKVSGIEILKEMRKFERYQTIPVVVLTSSEAEEDIARSYTEGANSYVSKPVDFEKFMKVVQSIEDFWLTVVKLPTKVSS